MLPGHKARLDGPVMLCQGRDGRKKPAIPKLPLGDVFCLDTASEKLAIALIETFDRIRTEPLDVAARLVRPGTAACSVSLASGKSLFSFAQGFKIGWEIFICKVPAELATKGLAAALDEAAARPLQVNLQRRQRRSEDDAAAKEGAGRFYPNARN